MTVAKAVLVDWLRWKLDFGGSIGKCEIERRIREEMRS